MGCGQSKIHLYPRKSKSKANGKKSGNDLVDADAEEDDEGHRDREKELNGHGKLQQHHHLRNDDEGMPRLASGELDAKGADDDLALNGGILPILSGKNLSLLSNQDLLSSSQQNFFQMLDQKIEEGPDYDSSSETEIALEEARLNALVQHWESASLSASLCSSTSRSLQSTPIRQSSNGQPMRMQPMPGEMVNKLQTMNSNMMSPKRVLPQAAPIQQGYQMMMGPMQQQQQQQLQQQQMQMQLPQYQFQNPQSYVPQQYTGGMLRTRPMGTVGPVLSGNGGVINPGMAMATQGQTNLGYYSQHPAMMPPMSHQMVYSAAAANAGMSIPQHSSPSQVAAAAYYGDLMQQHPMQVASNPIQMQQPMNPMVGYNPLITSGGMSMVMADATLSENKVFPAAISVQRLAPQVQRQIREIKDSCYGSPGPPTQSQPLMTQSGLVPSTSSAVIPPPPPQRTSTLRKNASVTKATAAVNNNTSHSQEYS